MNSSRSVKWIRTLLLALFTICAVCGAGIMNNARGLANANAATNYVECYSVKHTAEYDSTGATAEAKWINITSNPVDKGTVANGNYALLETPSLKKENEKTFLTWFSVRFVLGNDDNRVTTLTQSATHNGERLKISDKTSINETSTIPYHEQWTQDFYGLVKDGNIIADEIDADIVANAKTFLNAYVTKYSATNDKIASYDNLNGVYTIAYDYVPEGQARIHEEFSFYMLTSDVYSVNSKILIDNATQVTQNAASTDNYNRKFVYQFDEVLTRTYKLDDDTKVYQDEDSDAFNNLATTEQTENTKLLYPSFNYNPEHFVIS